VYFLSNKLCQDVPLPDMQILKLKSIYEAMDINVNTLHPSRAVAAKLAQINKQLMIMFSFEHMIRERKEEEEQLDSKIEQVSEIINA